MALQGVLFATGFQHGVVLAGAIAVTAAAATASVLHIRRVRGSTGAERRAWLCTAAGATGWVIGCLLHLYDAALGIDRASPRPADIFSGIAILAPALSLMLGPAAPSSWHTRLRLAVDGVMVSAALMIPAWSLLLEATYERHGADAGALGVAFPTVQIVALSVAIVLLSRSTSRGVNAYTMLAASFGTLAVAATTYTGVTTFGGTWKLTAVSGFFLSSTVIMAAVARYDMPGSDKPWLGVTTGGRAALPYVPVAGALGVAAILRINSGATVDLETLALFVMFLLVLVRQFLSLRVNSSLLAEVETQREQLRYQATHDHLTGLSNRIHLYQRADQRLRTGGPIGLLLVDLDRFKEVNDRFGHAAGDDVLIEVADVLRTRVPAGNTVARLGGDEFAVLLHPAPPPERMAGIAEDVIAGITAGGQVGASAGLAYEPSGAATIGMLLSDADAALYRAKAEGKGRVAGNGSRSRETGRTSSL